MKKESFLRQLLKKQTILDKLFLAIDDYEIYASLIGCEPELSECISSPIRGVDDDPSFTLFLPTRIQTDRPDEIWFKDLADGRFGNVIRFVKYFAMHHYDLELNTNYEVVQFLDTQLELGILNGTGEKRVAIKRDYSAHKVAKNIFYKSRKFTRRDLNYWADLDIDKEDLEKFNVRSVQYLLQEDGEIRKEFRRSELAFIYCIWDKLKLYQPNAPRAWKFRNTCPGDDYRYYQGFKQREGHDTLIITKSMKDVIVFWKYFNVFLKKKVDVIAPHAESINLPEAFIEAVKEKYKRVIVVSDFDHAGVKFANKCKRQGLEIRFVSTKRTLISGKYKVLDKDISDFRMNHDKEKTIKLLKKWDIA